MSIPSGRGELGSSKGKGYLEAPRGDEGRRPAHKRRPFLFERRAMISVPRMHYAIQLLGFLGLGLLWLLGAHIQAKWLRARFSWHTRVFYAIALLRELSPKRITRTRGNEP